MDSKKFLHSGTVLSIEQGYLRVGFESQSACGTCHARSKCGMVDSSTREVMAVPRKGVIYRVGDSVEVAISYQMGIMSVVIAYVVPLVILIGVLATAIALGVDQGVAALISLATVGLYYVVVYIFRSKLDKQIKFTIEK